MFSIFDFIIIGVILIIVFIFGVLLKRSREFSALKEQYSKLKEESQEYIEELTFKKIDFKYTEEAMRFMDKIIEDKYNFYMYTILIPVYFDQKIPEKKMIHDIKEKIYVSVVGGLQPRTKKSILEFFTEKGIEIYIHERILVHMNRTDFKTSGKYSEPFRGMKANGIDTLMP